MENRVLVIGDELFGPKGEAANRFVEAVLCREPSRPIQFSVNVPVAVSLSQIKARLSSDVIGKNAGRIIMGLGLRELNHGGTDGASIASLYETLVNELVNKTQSRLFLLTIPPEMFPIAINEVEYLNTMIREVCAANENRIVLLDFTAYTTEISPQLNKLLNDIYQQYHNSGLQIYQISVDQDNVAWRRAAQNLPWITVFDPMSINSQNIGAYNVTGIPTTFIIKNSEIVERVEDASRLKAAVGKYF